MKNNALSLIKLLSLLFVIASNSFAVESTCTEEMRKVLATNVIGKLQSKFIFTGKSKEEVEQIFVTSNLSNSCGPNCVVNAVQGVRELLGFPLVENPNELVKEIIGKMPTIFLRGTNAEQMDEIIKFALNNHFPPESYSTESQIMEILAAQNLNLKSTVKAINEINAKLLTPGSNEIITMSYLIFGPDKKIRNAHYVLVSGVSDNKISVIDPNYPGQYIEFTMVPAAFNQTNLTVELIPDRSHSSRYSNHPVGTKYYVYFKSSITVY